ncbi:hypothetical protein GCM10023085_14710 [Actinomadura viridis]|uniref:K+/H+ antiporter YhaU regulatory subunit KhtT n=1 Tax=Actinomadura viridis TaxID=58110 RepID=A0A931DTY3_9ACTN|nr:hypothetical protein [Actinomadura viridis]MBG6093841.1 K+/H+ antiporter YhaU regulatory subunit KhtT [Actinomadura viridis]
MQITSVTVPGAGVLHHVANRRGQRLAVLVRHSGERELFVYDTAPEGPVPVPADGSDRPVGGIELDGDEADQLAQLLQDQPVADRLAALERRLAELAATAPHHPH